MAAHRCLCVILTLWMVSSRPSASILPGAPVFGAWWGTPESRKIVKLADRARRAGDMARAEFFYRQGYADAARRRDERAMVGYLNGIAACSLTQLHYQDALKTLLLAKSYAQSIGDREALGAIDVNLSSLYLQVWDLDSALNSAEEGQAAGESLGRPYFLADLLIQLGRLHDIKRDGEAARFYRQGIELAESSGQKQVAARGLDLLGEERLGQKDLDAAGKAIEQGMRLRESFSPSELDLSWWRRGALELARGRLPEAAYYTDLALNAKGNAPEYRLKHQRGLIREAMGDRAGALADFSEAVKSSSRWRLEVLPSSASLTGANEMLDGLVFTSFIEAAAREAQRTGNPRWAIEAFEALELNRAASLRESLGLAEAWHKRVPGQYWEMLANFRRLDVAGKEAGSMKEASRRLDSELAEMEAKAGLAFRQKNSESFRDQTSLIHFRQGLGGSEILLSFELGERESYLWSVTRKELHLYTLGSKKKIEILAGRFGDAVQAGRPEAVELGGSFIASCSVNWGRRRHRSRHGCFPSKGHCSRYRSLHL